MRFDLMGRFVFLLAHPDDEFACSIRILHLVRSGHEVHCLYMTDGGYGGQSTAVRAAESVRALSLLGVDEQHIRFLGQENSFRDGELHSASERAEAALLQWLEEHKGIDAIFMPCWEGGHQDHDATYAIGASASARLGIEAFQFSLYHGSGLIGPFFRVMSPIPQNGPVEPYRARWPERWLAIRLCFVYASQWKTWLGLFPFFAWRMLSSGVFAVQPVDLMRCAERPHPGNLLYERRGFLSFAELQAGLETRTRRPE